MNEQNTKPSLTIPDPICSDIPGTWAYSTITDRLPEIARRTLAENEFLPASIARIKALIADIPVGPLRYLDQDGAPDAADWAAAIAPHVGQDWLVAPWFITETYFYRRILEATGYFAAGPGALIDPFAHQKKEGLRTTRSETRAIAEQLASWLSNGWQDEEFVDLLNITLWGNRADLSLWPAGEGQEDAPHAGDWQLAEKYTVVNDGPAVAGYLSNLHDAQIDILIDNAGLELVSDLALAHYLLATGVAAVIHLHVKLHPTFVSDAMIKNVLDTAAFLATEEDTAVSAFGRHLLTYLEQGRLRLFDHPFWVSPQPFWEMPAELRRDLSRSDLIISKGDANYRRLLGDRLWPFTTPFADILSYTPAPLLALRSLKSEIAAGLTTQQIEDVTREDADWQVNGRWGLIQFALPG